MNANWANELAEWLEGRGYHIRESGPHNPKTGRGWYSHPREYQREHVRVRINDGGIIVLRDPGCTIQVTRPAAGGMREEWSPNAYRLDTVPTYRFEERAHEAIQAFESRPAYTHEEAVNTFCKPATGVAS